MLEEPLFRPVVPGAGQAGEVDQEGAFVQRVRGDLWGQVEVEGHFAVGGGGVVGEFEEFAAEGGDGCLGLDGHCCCGCGLSMLELGMGRSRLFIYFEGKV